MNKRGASTVEKEMLMDVFKLIEEIKMRMSNEKNTKEINHNTEMNK